MDGCSDVKCILFGWLVCWVLCWLLFVSPVLIVFDHWLNHVLVSWLVDDQLIFVGAN